MKQKLFSALAALMLLCAMAIPGIAQEADTYQLTEPELRLSLPAGYVVFTRDIDENDPNLALYGLTKESISTLMTQRHIYFNAWDQEISHEIIVTMTDSPIDNMQQLSDTELADLQDSFAPEYEKAGITYLTSKVYEHPQVTFLKIYISQFNDDNAVYGLQYYTIYEGKAINITLQSYSGEIDDAKEAIIKQIVDSAVFGKAA